MFKTVIYDLIVHPDFRGQGLRGKLIDSIIEHPKLQDVESCRMSSKLT